MDFPPNLARFAVALYVSDPESSRGRVQYDLEQMDDGPPISTGMLGRTPMAVVRAPRIRRLY